MQVIVTQLRRAKNNNFDKKIKEASTVDFEEDDPNTQVSKGLEGMGRKKWTYNNDVGPVLLSASFLHIHVPT